MFCFTTNMIYTMMCIVRECDWVQVTWMYGIPYKDEKWGFWRWVMEVLETTDMPWFSWRDLTEVLWEHEKVGADEGSCNKSKFLMESIEKMD